VVLPDPYLSDAVLEGLPLSTCESSGYIEPLQTSGDYYDKVDWQCTLAPYVDKLYWKIDVGSQYEFPNNIGWERG